MLAGNGGLPVHSELFLFDTCNGMESSDLSFLTNFVSKVTHVSLLTSIYDGGQTGRAPLWRPAVACFANLLLLHFPFLQW